METGFRSWQRQQLAARGSALRVSSQQQPPSPAASLNHTSFSPVIDTIDDNIEQPHAVMNESGAIEAGSDNGEVESDSDKPTQDVDVVENAFEIAEADPLVSSANEDVEYVALEVDFDHSNAKTASINTVLSGRNMIALSLVKGTTGL